jgi:hypothetical protein
MKPRVSATLEMASEKKSRFKSIGTQVYSGLSAAASAGRERYGIVKSNTGGKNKTRSGPSRRGIVISVKCLDEILTGIGRRHSKFVVLNWTDFALKRMDIYL